MSDECAQCNKIRALPWSPTKRDMMAEHTMLRVCQARPVEAPRKWTHSDEVAREEVIKQIRNTAKPPVYATGGGPPLPHIPITAKPPESEALALIEQVLANPSDYLDSDDEEPLFRVFRTLKSLIEADAQRLKEVGRERDELRADRAKWVKVCAERDNRIVELRDQLDKAEVKTGAVAHVRNLVHRIKDYAGQHTQYPFANAIIDLCNQVLEPK